MSDITKDHLEWAVVDRLRLMLEEPPHQTFNVTQTYSLFTSVLCWVMQRIRIKSSDIVSKHDKIAHNLFRQLKDTSIDVEPWRIHITPTERIERIGTTGVRVPAPQGFKAHTAERFLINLRDATAHGDARNVEPFNTEGLLAGFAFSCAEFEGLGRDRKKTWSGEITLLEAEMRRIGIELAKLYCDAIRPKRLRRQDERFLDIAASIKERAA
jgi:hypothetical protein